MSMLPVHNYGIESVGDGFVRLHIARSAYVDQRYAEDMLTENERMFIRLLPEEKRNVALMDRCAAKHALGARLSLFGNTPAFADIEIISVRGRIPTYQLQNGMRGEPLVFSIAHSDTLSVAVALPFRQWEVVGVEVGYVHTFMDDTLQTFLSPREYDEHMKQDPLDRAEDATLRLCLKEAYLRALGIGSRVHPRYIEVAHNKQTNDAEIGLYEYGARIPAHVYQTTLDDGHMLVSVSI